MAPRGQSNLHQGLLTKKTAIRSNPNTESLSALGQITVWPEVACETILGAPASIAPAGQKLQINKGCFEPKKKGIARTAPIRTTYLKAPVHFGRSNFLVGIFAARSCSRPKGQTQPQIIEPKKIPTITITPTAIKGNRCNAVKFAITPIGQAKRASGQE